MSTYVSSTEFQARPNILQEFYKRPKNGTYFISGSTRKDLATPVFEYAYAMGPVGTQDTKDSNILKIKDEKVSEVKDILPKNICNNPSSTDKLDKNNINNITYDLNLNSIDIFEDAEVDNSILNLTRHVKRNIKSAKQDFDNFLPRAENFKNNDVVSEISTKKKQKQKQKQPLSQKPVTIIECYEILHRMLKIILSKSQILTMNHHYKNLY